MMKYGRKEFLNLDGYHGVAAISTSLDIDGSQLSAAISISDCSRVIHLDLDIYPHYLDNEEYDYEAVKNMLANIYQKAKTLGDVCHELADKIKESEDEYLEKLREIEAKRKLKNER